MRVLLPLLALLLAAAPLRAQDEPPRPELPRGADPNDWEALYDLGVKSLPDMPTRARASFYWASRLDPSRAEPLLGLWATFFISRPELFRGYLDGDRVTMARADVLRADTLRWRALMRNPFAHRGLDALVHDQLPGRWSRSREAQAWLAYSEARLDRAIRGYSELIESRPRELNHLLRWRALSYVSAGQYDSARVDLQRLLALLRTEEQTRLVGTDENKEMIEYSVGVLSEVRGRTDEARAALQNALVENAAFYPARVALGRIALAAGQREEAVAELAQAAELAPEDGFVRLQYGMALAGVGRNEDALAELRRARELEPHFADVHLHLAVALERAGARDEAAASYARFVDLSPRRDVARVNRVRAHVATLGGAAGAP